MKNERERPSSPMAVSLYQGRHQYFVVNKVPGERVFLQKRKNYLSPQMRNDMKAGYLAAKVYEFSLHHRR